MEFLDIKTGAPDPPKFCEQLAAMHRDSVSPTGKFGFDIITCHGPHPQNTTWEASWCVFFARLLRQFFDREIDTNDHDADYEALFKQLEAIIPKILEPLQAEGRYLKPCLIHGDLWEENTGTSLEEGGQPKIFDAAVLYAHNEYDISMWRRDICRFGRGKSRLWFTTMLSDCFSTYTPVSAAYATERAERAVGRSQPLVRNQVRNRPLHRMASYMRATKSPVSELSLYGSVIMTYASTGLLET